MTGSREMNAPVFPQALVWAVPSAGNTVPQASSQSSSSSPFWLMCPLLQESYLDTTTPPQVEEVSPLVSHNPLSFPRPSPDHSGLPLPAHRCVPHWPGAP